MRILGGIVLVGLVALGVVLLQRTDPQRAVEPGGPIPQQRAPEALELIPPNDDAASRQPVLDVSNAQADAAPSTRQAALEIEDSDGPWCLRVSVRTADGSPIGSDVQVLAFDEAGRHRVPQRWSEGVAGFRLLEPGMYVVWADGRHWEAATAEVVIIDPLRTHEVALTLQPVPEVRVCAVTPGGEPLLDEIDERWWSLSVAATDSPLLLPLGSPDERAFESVEIRDRSLSRAGLRREDIAFLELHGKRPAFVHLVARGHPLATLELPPRANEVCFVFDSEELARRLCRLHLRVVDAETDLPVEGGLIWHFIGGELVGRPGRIGLDGTYERCDLAPGKWLLRASVPGHALHEVTLDAEERAEETVTLRLQPARTLRGRVKDTPELVDTVRYQSLESFLERRGATTGVRGGTDGEFTFFCGDEELVLWAEVPAGESARYPRKVHPLRIDPTSIVEPLIIEFSPSFPLVVRTRTRCTLEILDSTGLRVERRQIDATPVRFELVEGDYVLRTTVSGEERSRQEIHLPPEGLRLVLD